jgi:large subunit ribosomal protein L13
MKTFMPKAAEVERDWYVVDANDQILGRLASQIAQILRGKHKPTYSPHLDVGDHVVVINAGNVRLTGRKHDQKRYFRHSGYPGGGRQTPVAELLARRPEEVIRKAVKGMLPKNRLGRAMLGKLKVYRGDEHPHDAQKPRTLALDGTGHITLTTDD